MALKVKPTVKRLASIAGWLAVLDDEDREDALEYLRHPDMYGHKGVAEAFAQHDPPYEGSEKGVAYWREKNLGA